MSPRLQEKLFAREYASVLLQIAIGDLATAEAISTSPQARIENALYMAQQAIEKGLKAVLVSTGIAVPLVHDLGVLVAKLPDQLQPPYGYELGELNQYASVRRYSTGDQKITEEEVAEVLSKAREMLAWCKSAIGSTP